MATKRKEMSKAPVPAAPTRAEIRKEKTRTVTAGESGGELHIHRDHKTHSLVFDLGGGQRGLVPVTVVSAEQLEREYTAASEPDTAESPE